MDNNDILVRLRYALDIKNADMRKIFELGGITVTEDEVLRMLQKSKDRGQEETVQEEQEKEKMLICNDIQLESFLNGFIIFKRGVKEEQNDSPQPPKLLIKNHRSVNNVLLKKLKIALELSSEDMLDILAQAGVIITKGELSAVFRKEGHRHYKECGDRYARNFLKGLAKRYRGV